MSTSTIEENQASEARSRDTENDFEDLKCRVNEALANIHLSEWMELDAQLNQANTEDAARLSIMMWETIKGVAERRRQAKCERLNLDPDAPCESFYNMPSMPYGSQSGYEIPADSAAHEILSLPYGDPEFIFEWSKMLPGGRLDKSRDHPRVVIVLRGNDVSSVSSDLPVEYFVLLELPPTPQRRVEEPVDEGREAEPVPHSCDGEGEAGDPPDLAVK